MQKKILTHKWFWKTRLPERKGQKCRVLARGKMNSILVEFEDGYKVVTSRFAVRKIVPILILILAQLACMTTTVQREDGSDGSPTARLLPTESQPSEPPAENAGGAVYQVPTARPLCAFVVADEALHLRAEPGEGALHLAYLRTGDQLHIIAQGHWWKVQTEAGITGYANSKYLKAELCK
jgi:SH3 domain-containing protein